MVQIVAIFIMLIGASMFGYFMGAMSTLVSALNSRHAKITQKRQAVDEFVRHRRVRNLGYRVPLASLGMSG